MFDGNDCHQSVPDVLSVKIFLVIFQDIQFPGILVHHPGQRHLEPGHERTAVRYVDAVAVGIDLLGKRVDVLERHLHFNVPAASFYINNIVMQRRHIAVNVFDITLYSEFFLKDF